MNNLRVHEVVDQTAQVRLATRWLDFPGFTVITNLPHPNREFYFTQLPDGSHAYYQWIIAADPRPPIGFPYGRTTAPDDHT